LSQGIGNLFKKALSGEGFSLMKMEGNGRIYLADNGKQVHVIQLQGETICINGNDVLALENTLKWDIKMMRSIGGMVGGGLFNVQISGHGYVAITSHHKPITLKVTLDQPVFTDPNATIAWSGSLSPEIKTDISWKTFVGRGSGESIQLMFRGDGWVVLQPFEEVYYAQNG